jgi:hypothetical protein
MMTSCPGRRSHPERGAVVVTVALSLAVLVGFAGLALDVGLLYSQRRAIQTAADGGALEGAQAVFRGDLATTVENVPQIARRGAAANGFTHGVGGVSVTVHQPPTSGPYAGGAAFVEVIVDKPSPSYLMRVLGFKSTPVSARAVAGAAAASPICIHALAPTGRGLRSTSSSQINANCGVVVNSSSSDALTLESSAIVNASNIDVTGRISKSSGSKVTPDPDTGVPARPDPLATLPPPSNANAPCLPFPSGGKWELSGTRTLYPGVYCGGVFIKSDGNVTFSPGMYVLRGGNLIGNSLKVDGRITGNGVTFYITASPAGASPNYFYRPIAFEGSSVVNLTAPTTGTDAGILFYQDPTKGSTSDINMVNSSSNMTLSGVLYFPTQMLQFNSSITITGQLMEIIARQIEVNSSARLNINANFSSLPGGSPLKRVSLVE